ncbi:hypothetical protein UFOVP554_14 [uncultured Caudovirales phage]|uniref:Uncharacterized protein n=1 Tax=uncultured Caudovirales phage TaxID=2100421 RepID=A0A6J5N0G3_9CAUD|nr:hypothetical protein UFOVP554_14 [uncultured Caudovirales phage]
MNGIELVLSIVGGIIFIQLQLIGMVKWLVKHYLKELIPNGGSSMKDQINRLEARQHEILVHLIDK